MLTMALSMIMLLSPMVDSIKLPYNIEEGIPEKSIIGTVIDKGHVSNMDGVIVLDEDWITMKSIIEGTDYCEVIANIAGNEVVKRVRQARDACTIKKEETLALNRKLREIIENKNADIKKLEDQNTMYRYVATGSAAVVVVGVASFFIIR